MVADDVRANSFYENEWDTCQPTRTLAALRNLIADIRRETREEIAKSLHPYDHDAVMTRAQCVHDEYTYCEGCDR